MSRFVDVVLVRAQQEPPRRVVLARSDQAGNLVQESPRIIVELDLRTVGVLVLRHAIQVVIFIARTPGLTVKRPSKLSHTAARVVVEVSN